MLRALPFLLVATLSAQNPLGRELWNTEPLAGAVEHYASSADGRFAATRADDERLVLWDLESGAPIAEWPGAAAGNALLAFSPDGELLAAQVPHHLPDGCRVFRTSDGEELKGFRTIELGPGRGRTDDMGRKWREGPEVHVHPSGATVFHPSDYRHLVVSSVARLPDVPVRTGQRFLLLGDRIVTIQPENLTGGRIPAGNKRVGFTLRVFELPTGRELAQLTRSHVMWREAVNPYDAVAFLGAHVAYVREGSLVLCDLATGEDVDVLADQTSAVISRAGKMVSGHADGTVRWWQDQREVARLELGSGEAHDLWSVEDTLIARCADRRHFIRQGAVAWAMADVQEAGVHRGTMIVRDRERVRMRRGEQEWEFALTESFYDDRDNRNVPVTVAGDQVCYLRAGALRRRAFGGDERAALNAHRGVIRDVWFAPDGSGRLIVCGRSSAMLYVGLGRQHRLFGSGSARWAGKDAVDLFELAGGWTRQIAVAEAAPVHAVARGGHMRVFVESGAEPWSTEVECEALVLSPDGQRLALARTQQRARQIEIWDVPARQRLHAFEVGSGIDGLEFVAGDRLLRWGRGGYALSDFAGETIVEGAAGPPGGQWAGDRAVAVSARANLLVAASHDTRVQVFDLATDRMRFEFEAPRSCYGHFASVQLAPDGKAAALHYLEGSVVLWVDLEKPERTELLRVAGNAHPVAFLPGGDLLVAAPEGLRRWRPGLGFVGKPGLRARRVFVSRDGRFAVAIAGARLSFRVFDQ